MKFRSLKLIKGKGGGIIVSLKRFDISSFKDIYGFIYGAVKYTNKVIRYFFLIFQYTLYICVMVIQAVGSECGRLEVHWNAISPLSFEMLKV